MDRSASRAPAAPSRWPVIDLVPDTGMPAATSSPNARTIALASATSPTGVEVACALMWEMSPSERPADSTASFMARDAPAPFGSGAVMWCASADIPMPARTA